MSLEVGQVLWLKVRYQTNIVAKVPHPMLVAVIDIDEDKIEVIAIDKAKDKITEESVFICHSIGCVFLAKYCIENNINFKKEE